MWVEPGMFRADASRPLDRLLYRGVAGMRFVAQRRENYMIKTLKQRKARAREWRSRR